MAISRMQEPQQIQSGIGSLQDPRQGYFLGKLVKKAGRAVKKIVKSPIGKMALIGGLGYGLGGAKFLGGEGIFKMGQAGRFGNLLNLVKAKGTASGKPGIFSSLFFDKDKNFSLGRTALTGLAGTALAAPFFMGGDDEEEIEDVIDVGAIRNSAANYYSGLGDKGAGLSFMPQKQFVQPNFYAAAGGRAMLNMGGAPGEQQAEQMLMAEFVKYKNRGGTLSFEQFVKAVMQASQQPEGAGMEQPEPVAMAANGGRIGYANAGPVVDEEIMAMIIDMNNKGMDISTISSITATPIETITQIISSMTEQANGGRVGFFQGGGADARDMIIPPKFLTMKGISEDPSLKVGGFGLEPHDTFYDKFGKFLSPLYYMEKLLEKKKQRQL